MKALGRLSAKWPGELKWPTVRTLPAPFGLGPLRGLRPPLLIALLAAVALHLLALSYRLLRAQRQPEPAQPQLVADDSPELLLFSRRQPLEETLQSAALPGPGNLTGLSLPPLSGLPLNGLPPAPPDLKPPGRLGAQPSSPPSRFRPARRSQGPKASLLSRGSFNSVGRSQENARDLRPSGADAALALIRRLQGRRAIDEPLKPSDSDHPSELELQRPDGERAAGWRRLWKGATVIPSSVLGQAAASEGVELRRLPLAEAGVDGLNADEPMALVMEERLLLLWPEGQTLWIWRAPLRGHVEPGANKL